MTARAATALCLMLTGPSCQDAPSTSFPPPASATQIDRRQAAPTPGDHAAMTASRRTAILEAVGRVAPSVGSMCTLRPWKTTRPVPTENSVLSLPMRTRYPGWNGVPTWRTMIEPGWAISPP